MPRKAQRATYTKHANGWTVRPTIRGKRYFLGYWGTEARAIEMANRFKARGTYETDEELDATAAELRQLASEDNALRRRDEQDQLPEGRLTLTTRVAALEARMARLENEQRRQETPQ